MPKLRASLFLLTCLALVPLAPACAKSDANGAGGAGGEGGDSSGSGCPACGPNAVCKAALGTCACKPGFTLQDGTCLATAPGDPSARTADEVCTAWKQGHVELEMAPLVTNGEDCNAGSLKQGAFLDTLARLNMFRWLSGLGPANDDESLDQAAQLCANLEAWWDFNSGLSPHTPPSNTKCYTELGGKTAGESNLAWGSNSPAQAIDQFVEDNGNEATMGHRRWIVNPPLGPVGIGYWRGGGQFGDGMCLRVFGAQGKGPNPPWVAVPNQGYVPVEVAQWTWTFHGSLSGIANAQIKMQRVDDGAPLEVTVQTLQQGFAQDAISWKPAGWTVEAGKTYRVTVSGIGGGDVTYDVKPIACL
jgi:hypothetical protein